MCLEVLFCFQMVLLNRHLTFFILLGCFSSGFAKDALCEASLTIPTGKCCHRDYARYCCSDIPVCADGGNVTVEKVVFKVDPCSTPWNLSACMLGYYSTNGSNILPCPEGYFCEENSVCLKPCPMGAYCIQNTLATNSSACGKFEQCCLPANTAPIFNEYTNSLLCPGESYPARCLEGYYCPNSTVQLTCPSGHFCREGSQRPVKCMRISSCGEGEKSPNTLFVGLLLNTFLFATFLLVLFYFNNRRTIHFYFGLYFRRIRGNRKPSQRYNLKDGLRLAISRLPQRREQDEDAMLCEKKDSYNISFEKLSLTLTSGENKGKVLLQGVTGEVNAGEVTAVLGPSGAGKTTFLNVLCGKAYYGDAGGTIRINGKKVSGIQSYKSLTGFVPQDDIMHRSLTVWEVLYYNAVLRLPPSPDPKFYEKIVKQTMSFLGIRNVANTQIGDEETRGISGGQRRRVNIGMELVANPTILFLDEPTTGLDSSSSLGVVKSLNTVATSTNMTICCVIHQPRFEILKMFDRVLFLGKGGRTVYSGSVDDAETYFANIGYPLPPYVNPADYYMDVISGSVKNETNAYVSLTEEWEKHQIVVEEVGSDVKSEVNKGVEDVKLEEINGSMANSPALSERSTTEMLANSGSNSSVLINVREADARSSQENGQSQAEQSPSSSIAESDEPKHDLKKPKVARPGFFTQLWVFMRREFVLQLRMSRTLLLDQALTMLAGAVLGLLFREVFIYDVHETTVLGNIISGLSAVVAASRRFGLNRVVFWRESAAGINRVSYFFAVNLAYIPILLISPVVYLSIYYSIAAFLAPFGLHYVVFLCAWFYLSGLGYVMSLIMTPRNSQMAAIVTVVIMAMLSGGSPELCKLDDTFVATAFYNLSFSRWVAEAIFEIEAKENSEVLSDVISRVQTDNHYDLESFNTCIVALLAMGVGFRVIALFLLLFTKRGQQK